MPKIIKNGIEYCSTSSIGNADEVLFDNSESELTSTSVQGAITELSDKHDNIQTQVNECFQSVSDGKALVASAITDKRVPTDATATFLQMATNIAKIVLGSGNATAADVLKNKTFTNDDGVEYTGTMTNNGAVSKSITPSTSEQSYIIPKGYHNGSGKVTVNAAPVSLINGTATAADVLSGKTFFSDSYTVKTGTMANNGAVSKTITPSSSAQTYTIPAGYHNGSGKVTVKAASIAPTHQSGSWTQTTHSSDGTYTKTITFPKAFSKTPSVQVGATDVWPESFVVESISATKTNFTVKWHRVEYGTSSNQTIKWSAAVV